MHKKTLPAIIAIALTAGASVAFAVTHVVTQKDKKFSVSALQVKVGETVTFRNDDNFFHNIFSLSPSNTFDLGSFGKGEGRNVTLAKEGVVDVECAIHPQMKMRIEVSR